MAASRQDLFRRYATLPDEEKWAFAADVIADLDGQEDEGVAEAWRVELDRRLDELDRGTAKTVPWSEFDSKIRRLLDEKKR